MTIPNDRQPDSSRFSLEGLGIGLTGGGGHIGSALALGLAEAGAIVVICGRRAEPLEEVARRSQERRLPGRVVPVTADLSNDSGAERVLGRLESEAGAVDGWVNNAYAGQPGRVLDATRNEIEATLASGLTNAIVATQAALAHMIPRAAGAIVNIASMYGLVAPQPSLYQDSERFHSPAAYGAAKAGLLQFTRYAACHVADRGVRVNAVTPGPFPHPTVQDQEQFRSALCARVPLGRLGDVDELIGPVVFLLSPAASYVTGHNLVVDGGWTAW